MLILASYVKELEQRLEAAEAMIAKGQLQGTANLPFRRVDGREETNQGASPSRSVVNPRASSDYAAGSSGESPGIVVTPADATESSATEPGAEISDEGETEVVDVNPLTQAVEFHGNTSSVAFLGRVRQEFAERDDEVPAQHRSVSTESPSLVSTIHNDSFHPRRGAYLHWDDGSEDRLFSPQLYVFIDTYFNNLHYIHPIINQATFLRRCEDIWSGHPERQPRNFIALYFAILSLGALIRTWTEEKINDMGRFEWSRMLFERADAALGKPGHLNDLEAIQTLFILAKICQNELNPNLAYMYLGMAIRSALSTGMNRNALMQGWNQSEELDSATSKTWWGLYTLEIEMSFALGRPDTLGMEDYHNRPKPPLDGSEIDILTSMIGLARIMRATSVSIYLSRLTIAEKLSRAFQLETEMDAWIESLPERIRPHITPNVPQNGSLRDPAWARMQKLVIQIRYFNVKMLMLRPFLLHAAKLTSQDRPLPPRIDEAIFKCTEAAVNTIDTIHENCRLQTHFRTWWYNTTYLTFAASILLFRAARRLPIDSPEDSPSNRQETPYLPHVEKTLEILDATSESIVSLKTAEVIRQMLSRLSERGGSSYTSQAIDQQGKPWPSSREGMNSATTMGQPDYNFGFPMWDLGGEVGMGHEWDFPGVGVDSFWPG